MAKHLWCWGDIINPDLADKALCAELARDAARGGKRETESNAQKPDPVPA